MKQITNKFLLSFMLVATLLASVSCEEFLNQAPSSEQPKEYIFEDYLRANRYMDLLYYYMSPTWTGDGKFGGYYGFLESATDMSDYSATYGATNRAFNSGNWKHNSASAEIDRWGACYTQIRRAYMFLDNMKNFNNEPEGRKVTMKGEVQFMLAYYYYELIKRYGAVPIVKEVLTLESDMKIPRSSVDEVVDFICENLDAAQEVLPDKWDDDNIGRATKAWTMALRSRVLLFAASPLNNPGNNQQKWIKAAQASKELIDYCDETQLHVLSKDWQNIFMRYQCDRVSEIIVYNKISANDLTFNSQLIRYEQATPGDQFWGYASNNPSQNFVDRFEVIKYDSKGVAIGTEEFDWNNRNHVDNIYKNRDPRFYYTVLYNGRFWIKRQIGTWRDGTEYGPDIDPKNHLFSKTGYYLRKFWPRECKDNKNPGSSKLSSYYIRLGEIYLNYAEAMNEAFGPDTYGLSSGTPMTAIDAINTLRGRLICPENKEIGGESDPFYYVKVERSENPDFPVLPNGMPAFAAGMSKEAAREKIQNERTIELAFEDQYFYDILRWKKGEELINGTLYGVDVVKSGSTYTYTKKKVEERYFDPKRMYLYPIPQDEVYNLGIEQNPGW
ncbi:MAG: RagB/SusD family nutrient uptake outer membrane protein [Bacteroidales bacterium]|nr:RagB/SusD family nutrient uptake outer membrane protein [Bacteroidales bacterium]MDD4669432.1 RagB/SusD family nutrient uptake outer membrane protein [Bacteroidales bacterium]